jgi:hypothetical protein
MKGHPISKRRYSGLLVLCAIGLFLYALITRSVLSKHVEIHRSNKPSFRHYGSKRSCQRGIWTTSTSSSRWRSDPDCNYHHFDVSSTLSCLSRYKRILIVGDSVQRGLFWNMIGLLKGIEMGDEVPSNVRYRMVDNLAGVEKSFTNVQDQEFIVTKDNNLMFSVRFVYAAHVTDFSGRCEAVSAWFFQCPEPLDSVLIRVLSEARERKNIHYDALYVNVGMWDWRTGVSVRMFERNTLGALKGKAKEYFSEIPKRIWRDTTAAYPSKFAWPKECKHSKIRDDSRPCNIHTDGIFNYNQATNSHWQAAGFELLDGWTVTATRPDLTTDGIHYEVGSKEKAKSYNYTWASTDTLYNPMYRVMNNMFFSLLCG